jgi:hypothetical protein
MDDAVGTLDIPVRTANNLDAAGILTVHALLLKSFEYLINEVPNVGEKSFNVIKLALQKKGFRRAKGRTYKPNEPLHTMYDGCFPPADDPMDLVADTDQVTEDEPELLSHKQALDRVVDQLEEVKSHFRKGSEQFKMLEWIRYYAQSRLPEPEE